MKRYSKNNLNWNLKKDDFSIIEQKIKHLNINKIRPREIFKMVLNEYSSYFNKKDTIIGDHSPLNTIFYKYIYDEFPRDKYIFLIRHPFDVVLSYSKISENPASDELFACWKWNNSISAYDYLKNKKCNVILIKYEDLVSENTAVLKKIQTFLNVNPEDLTNEKLNNSDNILGTKSLIFHENLKKPVNTNSVNRWQKELDLKVILKIKSHVSKNANRFNYDLNRKEN